jgi:glycosyltransferase involved in cell wall biosynthesis
LPNEDAIKFFAREILGEIKRVIPTVHLTVVGRNPSQSLINELEAYPEITLTGRVADVRPFIASHAVYVIPLRIGGGTRIKAYEAMAMGKAVVSTTVGVEGLPVKDGDHVVLADTSANFAEAVIELLLNQKRREFMGSLASCFVRQRFSWEKAAEEFGNICHRIAASSQN